MMTSIAAAALALAGAAGAEPPAPGAPRTFNDGAGRAVTLTSDPRRIVSLAPSVTEILDALGLGDRVVGVSDFCRIPAGAGAPARVGGLVNPDLERIVTLRPDLVVATTSGNYLDDAERMGRLGIPVYTCHTTDVESILSTVESLGRVLGAEAASARLVDGLRSRLAAVERRVAGRPRPRVLLLIWGDPLLAPGRGTFIDDALARAGAESISSDAASRWAEYDLEQVLAGRPEVVLTVPDNESFARSLPSRPEWAAVPAVAAGRVFVVSDAVQQPGPRIVDAIEEIARLLHPEPPSTDRSYLYFRRTPITTP